MDFKSEINELLRFKSDKYPIVSLYLKLGPKERENFKYKITLKDMIKEERDRLHKGDFAKEVLESVEADFRKISDFIENTDSLTACRGVAVFSSSAERLWEVFKLPLVYRNCLVVNSSALVRQLVAINDEFGDIAVVIVDRKQARLFRIGLSGADEVADYFYPEATRSTKFRAQEGRFKQRLSPTVGGGHVPHGYGEYGFNRMIEDEVHRHLKYVSERLFDHYKESKFDWLVIGGAEHILADFPNYLHTYLKQRLLGTITVDISTVRPDEIAEKALDLLEKRERKNEEKILEEFGEKLQSGLAVNGVRDTLKALMMGQVGMLLVTEGFTHPGFKCPESGVLVLEKFDNLCPEGKTPLPVADVVDEAIEEALGQRAEIEVIFNEEKKKLDGIGAILRFKL